MDWIGQHRSRLLAKIPFFGHLVEIVGVNWTALECCLVPGAGIEPALSEENEILSLACLPISPPGRICWAH